MDEQREVQIKALKTLVAIVFATLVAPFVFRKILRNPLVRYFLFFVSDYLNTHFLIECILWMSRLGLFWLVFRYWVPRRPW